MTAPGGSVGTAYISFHARTDRLQPELEAALRDAADDADDFLDRAGTQWGETLSDSASGEIRRHGRDFADSMEHALQGQVVSLGGVRYRVDSRGFLHNLTNGEFGGKIVEEIRDALDGASRPGGPFSKVGEGIADAIGAGFNVSGKSPLIIALIPVVGAIIALVLGLVQALNAAAAVLAAMPALVTAIGLQVGVVMLAFEGVGKAITDAFAAKNATELNEAIKNLTPSAQAFVRSLLPLRDLFKQIQSIAQENFFAGMGNVLTRIADVLGPIFKGGSFAALARAMGGFFRDIGLFFASPAFAQFVSKVIPATTRWLQQFGPTFVDFLTAVTNMANTALPFLERLGKSISGAFFIFTDWINTQIKNGNMTDWLDDMSSTIDQLITLFFRAAEFVASFMSALDAAGGDRILTEISNFLHTFSVFLQTEAGQAAMMGFVHAVEMLSAAFGGMIFTLMGVLIAFEAVLRFFEFVGQQFMNLIGWLTETAGPAIGTFFTETIPGFFSDLLGAFGEWWARVTFMFQVAWDDLINWFVQKWLNFTGWLDEKINAVAGFFAGLPGRLRQIGQDIMQGLRDGLQWGWDHTVGPILSWITNAIPDWKGPLDKDKKLLQPAGRQVMRGFGEGIQQGAEDLKNMFGTFTSGLSATGGGDGASLSPFVVNMNFHGQQPTPDQAYELGRAAGKGVSDEMAAQESQRSVRLAVRMA